MNARHLSWLWPIAFLGIVGGTAAFILGDLLHRPLLGWIGLGLAVAGGMAGMVGGGVVMAATLNDDDR